MILVYNTSLNYIKKSILLRGQPATAGFSSTRGHTQCGVPCLFYLQLIY